MSRKGIAVATLAALLGGVIAPPGVAADKHYDPGASDTAIKIGNIMPYSGPVSAYSINGKTEAAYFRKINDEGGINGRRIDFISYDDGYSPPKAVEQARKLVESDQVLLIFGPMGTPTNAAIRKYMNQKKVPQLFLTSGATEFGDPKRYPWTMAWYSSYQSEGRVYAAYLLRERPEAKLAVLYQNDDLGKDYLKGLKDGLGDKAKGMIAAELPYETTDPSIDSQVVSLKASGADVFVILATPKFAAQAIRKSAELGWHPLKILGAASRSVGATLKPAGLDNAQGTLTAIFMKDPTDPTWKDDVGLQKWTGFMERYFPEGDRTDAGTVTGYSTAQTMVQVLKQCGDDLSRDNIMKQAASIHGLSLPMLLPGITVDTAPDDYFPIEQLQLARFTGDHWQIFGPVMTATVRN